MNIEGFQREPEKSNLKVLASEICQHQVIEYPRKKNEKKIFKSRNFRKTEIFVLENFKFKESCNQGFSDFLPRVQK